MIYLSRFFALFNLGQRSYLMNISDVLRIKNLEVTQEFYKNTRKAILHLEGNADFYLPREYLSTLVIKIIWLSTRATMFD